METCSSYGCSEVAGEGCCGDTWCTEHLALHEDDHEWCDWCGQQALCETYEVCGGEITLCITHPVHTGRRCCQCDEALYLTIDGRRFEGTGYRACPTCDEYIGDACMDEHRRTHPDDDDDDDDDDDEVLHSHDYTPAPIFHGDPPRYYGVELEVDQGDSRSDTCEALCLLPDADTLFYLKQDGSLGSEGFEVVTHPATLKYHMKSFPWADIIRTVTDDGYKSHQTTTCGLHIHVSRRALGQNHTEQDLILSNLILLYWRHWKEIVVFSRRKSSEIEEWCKLNYRAPTIFPIDYQELDESKRRGKYAAINTDHLDTIEFRIFKGTLVYNTLIAAIQLTDVLIDLALSRSMSWIVDSTWGDIVAASAKYNELTRYLDERNLLCASL